MLYFPFFVSLSTVQKKTYLLFQELEINGLFRWSTSPWRSSSPASYASSPYVTTPGLALKPGSGHGWPKLSRCHRPWMIFICMVVLVILDLLVESPCQLLYMYIIMLLVVFSFEDHIIEDQISPTFSMHKVFMVLDCQDRACLNALYELQNMGSVYVWRKIYLILCKT